MNFIKNKIRGWLFPEYNNVCNFMREIYEAKLEIIGKKVTFTEPVVLVGGLTDCKVDIKPTIYPEINLSKFDYESALKLAGNYHMVGSCSFTQLPIKVQNHKS